MKSQVFSIDDRVEIVGPDKDGDRNEIDAKFAISQVLKRDGILYYSGDCFWWYPASSLRLVEEELKIGDWVKVIGPSIFDNRSQNGRIFQIQHINKDGEISLDDGDWLFRPASLRKLTPEEIQQHINSELKVGDYVLVVLPGTDLSDTVHKIRRIEDETREAFTIQLDDLSWWRPKSLQKLLTPEEIQQHTGTIGYATQKCQEDIEKATKALRDILAPLVDERLSAIEKRQDKIDHWMDRFAKVGARWETERAEMQKSIDVLEGIQRGEAPDVADCPNHHCMPNYEPIRISILRKCAHSDVFTCPNDALDWCKKALDSMREG